MVTSENGIIKKSTEAKEATEIDGIKSEILLALQEYEIDKHTENIIGSGDFEEKMNEKLRNGNITDSIIDTEKKTFVYNYKQTRYNIEIINDDIYVTKDSSNKNNKKDWKGCNECSEENPHIIHDKYEFDSIRTHINVDENGNEYIGGFFKLANDIYFYKSDFEINGDFYNNGNGFIPIGLKEGVYSSIWESGSMVYNVRINFDGENKYIKNYSNKYERISKRLQCHFCKTR